VSVFEVHCLSDDWLYYGEEVLDQNFSSVLDNVFIDCVFRFSPSLPRGPIKKVCVRMLLSHFMATRRNIMQLNEEQLREALSGSTKHYVSPYLKQLMHRVSFPLENSECAGLMSSSEFFSSCFFFFHLQLF